MSKKEIIKKLISLLPWIFLLLSLLMGLIIIDWADSGSVILDMWRAEPDASWVQTALIQYSDIIVAVLAAIIVALLSISITMYVFSKSALDRIIDENPYITAIVRFYQEETLEKLWQTALSSIVPLILAIVWYSILRFQPIESKWKYRFLMVGLGSFFVSVVVAAVSTNSFWKTCLGMRERLSIIIREKKEAFTKQIQKIVFGCDEDNLDCSPIYFLIGYWSEWETGTVDSLIDKDGRNIPKLANNNDDAKKIVKKGSALCKNMTSDQYINLFSRIEVLLMSGVGGVDSDKTHKYSESDVITVIQERSEIFGPTIDVEEKDLKDKNYRNSERQIVESINSFRNQIGLSGKDKSQSFFQSTRSLYLALKEYRDLLISERYVGSPHKDADPAAGLDSLDNMMGLGMYFFFLRVLGLFVSAVEIEDFTFNGNVLNFANFYNATLKDVSFYSSEFYHTIFSRTSLENVSMDLSKIDSVVFYYTKLSNSSMSNAVFSNNEFENAQMKACDLSNCVFAKCVVSDSRLTDTVFNGSVFTDSEVKSSDFSDSKLWNITFEHTKIFSCDFTRAEIKNWKWENSTGKIILSNCSFAFSVWNDMFIKSADLSDSVFGDASLIGAEFEDVKLENTLFLRCQLAQASFIKCEEFEQSSFQDANLFGAAFEDCKMDRSSFFRANASYASLNNCSIKNSDCAESNFRNAKIRKVDFENTRLKTSTFDFSIIEDCKFIRVLADNTQFTSVACSKTNFSFSAMPDSCFSKTTLDSCCLLGTDLSDSEATELTMRSCELNQTDLSRTRFIDCKMEEAKTPVKNCIFSDARFASVNGSTISGITFENCDFSQSVFSEMKIQDVTFHNCIFEGALFSNCQFKHVVFDFCTTGERGNEVYLTRGVFIQKHLQLNRQSFLESDTVSFSPAYQKNKNRKNSRPPRRPV